MPSNEPRAGCPPDVLLPLAPAIPAPSSSHRNAGGSCFTDMLADDCPACQPPASLVPAMDRFGMNAVHSVSLAWCVAEAAQQSQGSSSKMIDTQRERHKHIYRTGGAQRESP